MYAPNVKFNSLGITEFSINVDDTITLLMSIGAAGFQHTSMITLVSTVITCTNKLSNH